MSTEEIIYFIEKTIVVWFLFQSGYAMAVLLVGRVMIEYYEWGIFEKPSTLYEKTINTLLTVTAGVGPFVYKKLYKVNWLFRKILMLLFLILFGIVGIIIYQIVSIALRSLFL
ncbi:hypothetical protein [Mesobacillus jeotgali]|uniref:Uncharacterized protein n=1 Tax=Mesobacillus jeotgali TaxID=129985 RepID=A0ABY9VGJ3_9BACI|nr:hypothetical protein [Mesobacillus jeotgali]WNF22703.1 hypothetical protein RH061_21530 [Mesobacillus jeotgali]